MTSLRIVYGVFASGFAVTCLVLLIVVALEHDGAFVVALTALLTVMWGTMAANAWRRLYLAGGRGRREQKVDGTGGL